MRRVNSDRVRSHSSENRLRSENREIPTHGVSPSSLRACSVSTPGTFGACVAAPRVVLRARQIWGARSSLKGPTPGELRAHTDAPLRYQPGLVVEPLPSIVHSHRGSIGSRPRQARCRGMACGGKACVHLAPRAADPPSYTYLGVLRAAALPDAAASRDRGASVRVGFFQVHPTCLCVARVITEKGEGDRCLRRCADRAGEWGGLLF